MLKNVQLPRPYDNLGAPGADLNDMLNTADGSGRNPVSKGLASYESIKKFILLDQPFNIESGELTPSLKVKRKVVEENYKEDINFMYEEELVKV